VQKRADWFTVLQFALSILAIFILWSGALILASLGVAGLFTKSQQLDTVMMFVVATSMAAMGFLLIPSAWYSLLRILDKRATESPAIVKKLHIELWILLFPVILVIGYLSTSVPSLSWLILPPMHVLAISLSVLWLLWVAAHNLPLGSPQRMWGVFGSGLALSPFLIMIVESMIGLFILVLGVAAIATQPELVNKIRSLSEWISSSNPSQEAILQTIGPYLIKPVVVVSVLVFAAMIVPLIEEALKPVGVWLLWGRKITPGAGFAAGALSGAGYALAESLAVSSSGMQWASLVVARVGTAVVHILASGIMGWAIVQVWQGRRYFRLVLVYLVAISIHGFWNAMTLYFSFYALAQTPTLTKGVPQFLKFGSLMPFGLIFMAVAGFLALIAANHVLVRSTALARHPRPPLVDGQGEKPGESML